MQVLRRAWTFVVALLIVGGGTGRAWAGEREAAVHRMEALNGAAIASYAVGYHTKAREQLIQALAIARRGGLGSHPAVARTYVHLGIVHLEGLGERDKAMGYFRAALRMRPSIEVTPALATANVLLDFEQARAELPAGAGGEGAAAAKIARAKEERERRHDECEAEMSEKLDGQREALEKDIAIARDGMAKERQAREELQKEKLDVEKQLAAAREGERKEREHNEQLQKEKGAQERLLAQARASEGKEREARAQAEKQVAELKDRLDKERETMAARERERQERSEQERLAQDKQGDAGPPSVFCAAVEKTGGDVGVRCVAPRARKGKSAATLYYRAAGANDYQALAMKRSGASTFSAVILGSNVNGTLLQFYVQASSGHAVAMNGQPAFPNIVTVHPRATTVASDAPADRRRTTP